MTALKDPPRTEPEVLIDEARRRQRNRHRVYAVVLGALATAALYLLVSGAVGRPGTDAAPASAAHGAAVAPPSDAIAFEQSFGTDPRTLRTQLASVPASGGRVVALTHAPKRTAGAWGAGAAGPRWLPDGSEIAFSMTGRGVTARSSVYVMNADGTDIRKITHGVGASNPSWSPDGSQIAFVANPDERLTLGIVNADGSGQHLLRVRHPYVASPAWSPDGRAIAFDAGPGWFKFAIFTIRPNGTGERQLTPFPRRTSPDLSAGGAAWSPDGSRIAYSLGNRLWIMHSNGTGARPVTTCRLPCISDSGPAWSPTGRQLVFVRDQEHPLKHPVPTKHGEDTAFNAVRLYVLRLSTGAVRLLTPNLRNADDPDWRP